MTIYESRLFYPAIAGYVPLHRRLKDFGRGLEWDDGVALFTQLFSTGDLLAVRGCDLPRMPLDLHARLNEFADFLIVRSADEIANN